MLGGDEGDRGAGVGDLADSLRHLLVERVVGVEDVDRVAVEDQRVERGADLGPTLRRDEDVDVDVHGVPWGAVDGQGDGAADRVGEARLGEGAVDGETFSRGSGS